MPRRAVPLIVWVCFFCVFCCVAGGARGDDVPAGIRADYDEALARYEAGELKPAFTAISKAKGSYPASADYWELYVRIWRGLGKKERVLWEKTIAKAETKHEGSPVFHVLRARFAAAAEERIAHLARGVEVAPEAAEPRALLAREYVHTDPARARTLVDAVLRQDPAHELALAVKGTLQLAAGRAGPALAFAEAKLERHDYPALHDLAARALLAMPGSSEQDLERAEAEARKAHGARPREWRFGLTLVEILDRRGQGAAAKQLLERTYAKTPAPDLAAKRGEFAFREGDYVVAAKGIAMLPYDDVRALKALVVATVRLGRVEEAHGALGRLLARQDDDETRLWVARQALELGEAANARRHLERLSGEAADRLRLAAAAWAGDVAAAKGLAGTKAERDTRTAEEWLLPVVHALLFEKLGTRADAARTLLLSASVDAAKAHLAAASVPAEEPLLTAHSLGFIQRYATYRRALDGSWFEPLVEMGMSQRDVDDWAVPIATVEAHAACAKDRVRLFPFRPADAVKDPDLQQTMTNWLGDPAVKRWGEALAGFGRGCKGLMEGSYREARGGFRYALEREPGWGRARLFLAVATALEGKDMKEAAADAERAAGDLIDDWDGRTAAILVRALAKQNVTADLKALAERRESFAPRRYEDL